MRVGGVLWGLLVACDPQEPAPSDPAALPSSVALRRLSVEEYDRTVSWLLGLESHAGQTALPADPLLPFDNVVAEQEPSVILVEGAEEAARALTGQLRQDPARLDAVVGCDPAGAACLEDFVHTFARRALRRPAAEADLTAWVQLAQEQARAYGDPREGVLAVIEAVLQDPWFLYRVEAGEPADGRVALDGWSVAARLSYLLVGGPPDDALLADAEAGRLASAQGRKDAAERLLADPRLAEHLGRFHALWLGYHHMQIVPQSSGGPLREEADMLIRRLLVEERAAWTGIFLAPYTWTNDAGAEYYGLTPAGTGETFGWVDYGDADRSGLLSQGAFATVGNNAVDTSPTKRGKLVLKRLLCEQVPDPPPLLRADSPPPFDANACKWDRYVEHRTNPACASCHDALDGIGFGLEAYDNAGHIREHDYYQFTYEENPDCAIAGEGSVPELGAFRGAKELAGLITESERAQRCVVRHLRAYARGEEPVLGRGDDEEERLLGYFRQTGWRFDALLVELAGSEEMALGDLP